MDNFITEFEIWAKGDVFQGKVMFAIGILLLVLLVIFYRSDLSFLKGMIIPIGLLMAANLGYGGFMTINRPNRVKTTTALAETHAQDAVQKELEKAEIDNKSYSRFKPMWVGLMILAAGLYFAFSKEWYQGLSLGLVSLFLGIYFVDLFLHHRLKPYLEVLRNLSETTG